MSIRETIQILHPLNIEAYLDVLRAEFGAQAHPRQAGAFQVDGLPFYRPQAGRASEAGEYVFVLGFNYLPLPGTLLRALAAHPELVPEGVQISWTQEQELLFEGSLAECLRYLEEDT
jgi:hypothetical protein